MTVNAVGFVVTAVRDDGSRLYMAIDAASGGYEWWTTHVPSARIYSDAKDAWADLKRRMRSTLFHAASGADYAKPDRTVLLGVDRLDAVELVGTERHRFSLPARDTP